MSNYEHSIKYNKELCPDGICTKPSKNFGQAGAYHPDGRGICGGKLIRVFNNYGPHKDKFGEFFLWEELQCSKCRFSKQLRLVRSYVIKFKEQIWIKQYRPKRKYENDRKNNEYSNEKTIHKENPTNRASPPRNPGDRTNRDSRSRD